MQTIAKANLWYHLVWVSICAAIATFALSAIDTGTNLSESMYYHIYGQSLPYIVLFCGLFGIFEFSRTLLNRNKFIAYQDGFIIVRGAKRIKLTDVSSVKVINGILFDSIVISEGEKRSTVLKSIEFDGAAKEVARDIDRLRKHQF